MNTEPNTRENTPEHCWECWKFSDCQQAQHMTKDTHAIEGFVVPSMSDYLCFNCLTDLTKRGYLTREEEDDSVPLDWEELDSPTHCSACGAPLIHSLTEDGVAYLKEMLADGGGCCRELWPVLWADYLEEQEEEEEEEEEDA